MNNFRSIKYSALLLPAFAMGVSVASADEHKDDDPCKHENATAKTDQDRGRIVAGDPPMTSTRDNAVFTSKDTAVFASKDDDKNNASDRKNASDKADASDRNSAMAKTNASDRASATARTNASAKAGLNDTNYLATRPANNFFSTNLIGQDITNKRNGEVIGTVDEILIDRNGQVGAVILSTGGLMGLGEKDVAIAWDQITRTMSEDDEIELSVDFTEASLADAPTFERK